ncbi:MAG: DUF4058 family protein [Chloroflexi bacterium]|nr:DUF4058 family protein [Chloroflexota bacterium]
MPSPLPGMDPYLEGEMWQEFHATLANAIRAQILAALPPHYTALLAKRYVLDYSPADPRKQKDRVVYPDVHVAKIQEAVPVYVTAARAARPMAPAPMISPYAEAIPHLRIEIRDVAERRLVTLIEILSPAKKVGQGADDYDRRRRGLLKRDLHLLEIDLLRGGRRITLWGEWPPGTYYVYLSRAEDRPVTDVWPIGLCEPLPVVPVPLLEPDPDVTLDLQAAVNACFDLVHYERLLDYSTSPTPPDLASEDAAWVDARLAAAGLRSSTPPE